MTRTISLLVLLALPICTSGQTVTGTLLGTVTDVSGSVVPNAAIMVTETATNVARRSATNDEGI